MKYTEVPRPPSPLAKSTQVFKNDEELSESPRGIEIPFAAGTIGSSPRESLNSEPQIGSGAQNRANSIEVWHITEIGSSNEVCIPRSTIKITDQYPQKVISGGQDGVDIAALRVAKSLGIPTGGHIPFGFLTVSGKKPELGFLYGLEEMKFTASTAFAYIARSKKNIDESSAVLAFYFGSNYSSGTAKSITYAAIKNWTSLAISLEIPFHILDGFRPVFVITEVNETSLAAFRLFLQRYKPTTLNVVGSREKSYENIVEEFLWYALGPKRA